MPEGRQIHGEEALQAEVRRLGKVVEALMNRAERVMNNQHGSFGLFQNTLALEQQVRRRTRELEAALRENEAITRDLQSAQARMAREIEKHKETQAALEREKEEQKVLISKLESADKQLLQSEKLASIGQLAAGVAHEINNPICFVNSNLFTLRDYVGKLGAMLDVCEDGLAQGPADAALRERIAAARREHDIEFVREELDLLIGESLDGIERVRVIVRDLRDFSRAGEAEWKMADLHQCLDSTLNVVRNEIRYKAEVVKEYGELPPVECFPSQLNQVFMNLLVNAAQAIEGQGTIAIRTGVEDEWALVTIADSGTGIPPETLRRIFDPFFTTKPVGKGTGLGLSLCYGIVERHGGRIDVHSVVGKGSTFTVRLPLRRGGR